MSYVEEPAGLEGYAAYDGQGGNMQEEWMRNYFQPTGFAPVQQHHMPVDNGLYASYASDVSDISVASIADDMYDPALIPQGYEAPVVFDHYAYGGYNPAAFMPQQYVVQHQPRQVVRTMQVPQMQVPQWGDDIYVEDEGPIMMQQNFPERQYVQQQVPVQAQARRVTHHQMPSQAQLQQGQVQQQSGWAPVEQMAPQQHDAQPAQIGISIWQKGSWHVIASVTPGSSAQTQGLQPGDVLRKLDRVPCKGWDHDKIMEKLRGYEGSPVIVRTNTKKLRVIRDCAVVDRPVPQGMQQQYHHQPQPQPQPQQSYVQQPMQQPMQHQYVQQPVQQRIVQQPMVQQRQIQYVQQPIQQVQVQQVPVHQPQQFVIHHQQQPQPQQFVIQQPMQQQVVRQVVQMPQQQIMKTVQVMPGMMQGHPGMMPGQPMMMQF